MLHTPLRLTLSSLALTALLAGCPEDVPPVGEAPILEPEPAGAPIAIADGRLSCLGNNAPTPPAGRNLTLPGYTRALADPGNTTGAQPPASVEAFDSMGSLATAFASTSDGRVAVTVPIEATGFDGWVRVTAAGFVPTSLYSSRPYTSDAVAGWAWMPTPAEVTEHATMAGTAVTPGQGTLVGAVHDCDVFGVANAVIRYAGRTDGVVYYDGFAPSSALTFTAVSGRFAVANVPPGPVTVEAFGRLTAAGPLTLLSRADVTVTADEITAVDLQPRVAVER